MHDRVEYEMPFGLLGELTHNIAIRSRIEEIFTYRERVVPTLVANGMASSPHTTA